MSTKLVWLIVALALSPRVGFCWTEVGYQLNIQVPASSSENAGDKPVTIEFQDRTWATPGVEQSSRSLPAAKAFDFASNTGPRFRFQGDGPNWLDDVCFPLTRQLFHQSDEGHPYFSTVICESSYVPRIEQQKVFLAH